MKMRSKPICLSIDYSDPLAKGGIEADLKSYEANGVYGMTIITALPRKIEENTDKWEIVPKDTIEAQLETLLTKYTIKCVKLGMFALSETVEKLLEMKEKKYFKLIVTPNFTQITEGLTKERLKELYLSIIIPKTDVLIVNQQNASILTGIEPSDFSQTMELCLKLSDLGPEQIVLVGDSEDTLTGDFLFQAPDFLTPYPRSPQKTNLGNIAVHGTGCVFGATMTAQLALKDDIYIAMEKTENFMEGVYTRIVTLESAGQVLDMRYTPEEIASQEMVAKVYDFISHTQEFLELIPNMGQEIISLAGDLLDKKRIALIEGRVHPVQGLPQACGSIIVGKTTPFSQVLLTAKSLEPQTSFVVTLRYDSNIIRETSVQTNLVNFEIDDGKKDDFNTDLPNALGRILELSQDAYGKIPDLLWDAHGVIYEPLIWLFAQDADDAITKLKLILKTCTEYGQ